MSRKFKFKGYYYTECPPNCFILHRANSSHIAFLQDADARQFEQQLDDLSKVVFPSGCFQSYDQLLSAIIDQYDC